MKNILLGLFLTAFVGTAFAQQAPVPGQRRIPQRTHNFDQAKLRECLRDARRGYSNSEEERVALCLGDVMLDVMQRMEAKMGGAQPPYGPHFPNGKPKEVLFFSRNGCEPTSYIDRVFAYPYDRTQNAQECTDLVKRKDGTTRVSSIQVENRDGKIECLSMWERLDATCNRFISY
jgi:hypothetical protein